MRAPELPAAQVKDREPHVVGRTRECEPHLHGAAIRRYKGYKQRVLERSRGYFDRRREFSGAIRPHERQPIPGALREIHIRVFETKRRLC